MAETRDSRAKEIFLDALDLGERELRPYLASACGTDESLLRLVEDLLAAHERARDIEALAGSPEKCAPEPPLALVGDYELFEELAYARARLAEILGD